MAEKFSNKASTTLNGAINNAVTSLVVTSATGFPTTGTFRIVVDPATASEEIMTVTAVSGTTYTVTRASEAIAGVQTAFSHADLAVIKHVLTAGAVQSLGLIFLEQQTASVSATLDFTTWYSTAYDEYIIEFLAVLPATAGANLLARASVNGGSSYDSTTGNYVGTTSVNATFTAWAAQGGAAVATNVAAGGTGPFGVYGHMRIFPAVTRPWFVGQTGYLTNTPARVSGLVSGDYEPAAFNAIRFLFSTGNITSGTIRIYGVAK